MRISSIALVTQLATLLAFAPLVVHGNQTTSSTVKIYMYNLTESRILPNPNDHWWVIKSLYGLEMVFPQLLLNSSYVTSNPEEATHFYVWAWIYSGTDKLITKLIDRMKIAGPWWERNGGKDHIFVISHDQGMCDSSAHMVLFNQHLSNSVVLQHWGRASSLYLTRSKWNGFMNDWHHEVMSDMNFVYEHELARVHEPGYKPPLPCYARGKGMVVPTVTSEDEKTTRFLNSGMEKPQTTLIIFGGGINWTHLTHKDNPESDAEYSFGVRQTFANMFQHHSDIKVFYKMIDNYWDEFHASVFCLAPAGWGWGARVKSAVTRGCIPVIVQDGIKVEWEDQLPFQEFAIRLPMTYMHRLPEILNKYKRLGLVPKMQKNLKCVWRLFWWNRPHGRAFEMVICVLRARMAGSKVHVDFNACTIRCGDGRDREINSNTPFIV